VGLLQGCVVPILYPEVLRAASRLLSAAGHRVVAPASGCCGALALHAGDPEEARRAARRTIDAFLATRLPGHRIVSTAAGCGAMMREYGHLLAGDPAYAAIARDFAGRVADVSEVLLAAGDRLQLRPLPLRATYHDACHLLHGQGVKAAPRALLARIPGLELVPLTESEVCCGSAGSYNLTEPEMADRLLARKTNSVLATGASLVVTGNPGCMLQMAAGLRARGSPVQVRHTVEVLAAALARDRPD
jgi:glycolate oxidase iron-sulfur subunit